MSGHTYDPLFEPGVWLKRFSIGSSQVRARNVTYAETHAWCGCVDVPMASRPLLEYIWPATT